MGTVMPDNCIASIVVLSHGEENPLRRTFQSLARQTLGLERVEVVFAPIGSDDPGLVLAGQWQDILACPNFRILEVASGQGLAARRTNGFALARGAGLLGLAASVRLDPRFLEEGLAALAARPEADLVFSDYLHAGRSGPGLVRLPDFDADLLRCRNVLGPVVLLRRGVFERLGGFKDNTSYPDWDFWLRAAAGGHGFLRIPRPLYSVEDRQDGHAFRARAEDGRAKAMLVINNPSFFDSRVVRWALEHLRGSAWATAYVFGAIPAGHEVLRLMADALRSGRAADAREAEKSLGRLEQISSFRRWHSALLPS